MSFEWILSDLKTFLVEKFEEDNWFSIHWTLGTLKEKTPCAVRRNMSKQV